MWLEKEIFLGCNIKGKFMFVEVRGFSGEKFLLFCYVFIILVVVYLYLYLRLYVSYNLLWRKILFF